MYSVLRTLLAFVLIAAAGFSTYAPMVAEWRKKAEVGEAEFQRLLGLCYNDDVSSDVIPLDYVEAVKWFCLAAEQGDALALGTEIYRTTNTQPIPR